jgi:hypothetical protein
LSEHASTPLRQDDGSAEARLAAVPKPALLLALGLGLAALALIPSDAVPWLRGPAPYPPEWQWGFRPEGSAHALWPAAACALALVALLACSFVASARRRPRAAAAGLVAVSVALGTALPVLLLAREPDGPLLALMERSLSPYRTSYQTVAVSPATRDPLAFLRAHAALLPELAHTAKHAATHPPGPVLFYRAALGACEASPWLTRALLRVAGARSRPDPEKDAHHAGALLGDLLLSLLGSATAWPLLRLGQRLGLPPLEAARVALLWALVPGPALMTPQFDQALALPVVAAVLCLVRAAQAGATSRLLGWAALAGIWGGAAAFTSYGAPTFLTIGGGAALLAAAPPGLGASHRLRRGLAIAGAAAGASGLLAFGLPAALGHEALRALRTALAIHHAGYTAPRSYALWLAFGPLDLAVFLGLPLAVLAVWRAAAATRQGANGAPLRPPARFALAAVGGVALLVLSGTTRGEVGRIWIPLMPLLLLDAATDLDGPATVALGLLQGALTLVLAAFWTV